MKRNFSFFLLIFFAYGMMCFAQDVKPDSMSSVSQTQHRSNALRFAITPNQVFQSLGAKHWFSDLFALSWHCVGAFHRLEDRIGNDLLSVRDISMYGGFYTQGEYHWSRGNKILGQDISPYLAAGVGFGINQTPSWFIVGSIIVGVEIFLTPSISLAVEQGADISYENVKYVTLYRAEPLLSLLPFSKAGNNKLLLHIYF